MRKLGKLAIVTGGLLAAGLLCAPAAAQEFTLMLPLRIEIPNTIPFIDKNGTQIGTATLWENKLYIRDLNGEILATIVSDAQGKKTMYDPHGKAIDQIK